MNKLFKTTVAAIMSATTMLSAASVFADFPDMPEDETRVALENAVENGLLTGYETGEIKPYDKITRAQMGAIIVRALGATQTADLSEFKDMNESQWYYDAMSKAVAMGAFQGDGENLNPEANITFQEAFAVIARIFDLQSSQDLDQIYLRTKKIEALPEYTSTALDKYSDKDKVAEWAFPTTLAIVEGGFWAPETEELRPTDYINRVEFAVLMDNLITTYIDEPGEYNVFEEGNILIRSKDVVIDNLEGEKVDIFIGDGVDGEIKLGEEININRIIQRGGAAKVEGGIYNQVRVNGHNCKMDMHNTMVTTIIYGKYADAEITNTKDVG